MVIGLLGGKKIAQVNVCRGSPGWCSLCTEPSTAKLTLVLLVNLSAGNYYRLCGVGWGGSTSRLGDAVTSVKPER